MSMLVSHLKVAFRSMKKHRFYSAVNILGLSFAIGFVLLSFQFIRSELSYDQFHNKKDHLFRLYHEVVNTETNSIKDVSAVTAIPLSKDLQSEVPDIQDYTRIASGTTIIIVDGQPFEESIHYVDPGFLKMFDFPLLDGGNSPLEAINSMVISKEKATKLFGMADPIGKIISVKMNDTKEALTISGVIDPKKSRSSLPFDFLVPLEMFKKVVPEKMFESYNYGILENYILTNGNKTPEELAEVLTQSIQKFSTDGKEKTKIGVQPLASIHLEDQIIGNASFTSPMKLYIMSGLAILVLVIALINFITLSTSHALNRSKEIGLRTTLGALKHQLKRQMISESFFVVLLAGLIGIVLARSFLPIFAQLIETQMNFSFGWKEVLFFIAICLVLSWINGNLQALFLIKSNAIHSLKADMKVTGRNSLFNQSLLVLQFSLSILLIIGALGMQRQMAFIQNKDLGYDKERLVEINLNSSDNVEAATQLVERFRSAALQNQQIVALSASMNNAREPWTELKFAQTEGPPEGIYYNQIDPAYLRTMNIDLVDGENFRENASNPQNAILVNEALIRHFGWEDPFDKQIPGKNFSEKHQIIGVVKDYHFSSLHQQIEPLILSLSDQAIGSGITGLSTYVWPPNLYQLLVRIGPGELPPVIQFLEDTWNEVAPDKAFVYQFVDEVLDAKYAEERRWAKVMNGSSLFAIFIAWLGLLGLMRLSVQKRTKEIGIRKVLGASTTGIIQLLSKQYILLVVIGILVASPLGWMLMSRWLTSFSYQMELSPGLFLIAGISVLLITVMSLSLQSFKAAMDNPVESLRAE